MVDVKVFTLNCWGIFYISSDRIARMKSIAQHLADADYDVVVLQEVWCQEDFQRIRSVASEALPFSHFFDNGIIGSGTCVLSKAAIQDATFHEFSMNGYPQKILHGDWFAGKGLGVCHLDYKGLNINVFVSHLHAEYSRKSDIYLGHRVMQALEAAQWIKLTSSGADLTIYAGDFNTEPVDVPYSIIRTVVPLKDAWMDVNGPSSGETCATPYNSYTTAHELLEAPTGKRIDYIMFNAGPNVKAEAKTCCLPLPRSIPASLSGGKDVSYSDHEAVTAEIRVEQMEGGLVDNRRFKTSMSCIDPQGREEAVRAAMGLITKAIKTTLSHQKIFTALAFLALVLLSLTFTEYIFVTSGPLDGILFVGRLILTLFFVYFGLMATVFSRKERHALYGTKATLALLQQRCNATTSYGSIGN